MKGAEEKLNLVKQILISDDKIGTDGKVESKETASVLINDTAVPITPKINTTVPATVVETTSSTITPKSSVKSTSTVTFEDSNNVRLSRKVSILVALHTIKLCRIIYLLQFLGKNSSCKFAL